MAKKTPETNRRRVIEEQRRKARAKERRTTALVIILSVILGGGLIGGAVYAGAQSKKHKKEHTALNAVGVSAAKASCDAPKAEDVPKDALENATKHTTETVDYGTNVPPTSGRHNPTPLVSTNQHFWSRDSKVKPEQAVHNLEHGFVVVWYDKTVSDADIELLKKAADSGETKLLVVPWLRGDFPNGKHIVLTAWSERQTCNGVSGPAMQKFVNDFGGAAGKAPEKQLVM